MNLGKNVKITSALAYATGTASRNGAILDMEGYESAIALVKCATLAQGAVGDIHWEQDTDSAMNGAADLAGTAIAIADDDDDQDFVSELVKPRERYVRVVVTKDGSNAQAESGMYIQYAVRKAPVTNTVADTLTMETHISPAEGTK